MIISPESWSLGWHTKEALRICWNRTPKKAFKIWENIERREKTFWFAIIACSCLAFSQYQHLQWYISLLCFSPPLPSSSTCSKLSASRAWFQLFLISTLETSPKWRNSPSLPSASSALPLTAMAIIIARWCGLAQFDLTVRCRLYVMVRKEILYMAMDTVSTVYTISMLSGASFSSRTWSWASLVDCRAALFCLEK